MLVCVQFCAGLLVLLHLSRARVIHNNNEVFLQEQFAASFLSRSLLYNSWDLELVDQFWEKYTNSHEPTPWVDVSGLVAGILALLVSGLIATVLGCYCYKARNKSGRAPVRTPGHAGPAPEVIPLSGVGAPGLPSYSEALNRSGQHDCPPPPYSGGAPSEAPDPAADE
ncbi:hypothetical protein JZ751_015157 [Albula glossodonta]|uniref:Uncharacterized protein n=1 Tax=Albula glossodonta TaxID=121402 RepID=A0A8T2NV02_9TELE|nr:hypothetical protein JZ751_015157 [Albula glossodonta]